MYKGQLYANISTKTGVPYATVEKVLDAFTDTTAELMTRGESVVLSGFGIFEPKSRSPRIGRNPHTGAPVEIPARVMPSFKPAQGLKDRVSAMVYQPASKSLCDSPTK